MLWIILVASGGVRRGSLDIDQAARPGYAPVLGEREQRRDAVFQYMPRPEKIEFTVSEIHEVPVLLIHLEAVCSTVGNRGRVSLQQYGAQVVERSPKRSLGRAGVRWSGSWRSRADRGVEPVEVPKTSDIFRCAKEYVQNVRRPHAGFGRNELR